MGKGRSGSGVYGRKKEKLHAQQQDGFLQATRRYATLKTVIGGLTAGLAVGAVLQMLGVPEPVIIGFSAGVTAAIVFTFGRNAGK